MEDITENTKETKETIWQITTAMEAERTYKKLKKLEDESQQYINICKFEIKEYEQKIQKEELRIEIKRNYYKEKLREFTNTQENRSIRLPSITLKYVRQQLEYVWNEEKVVKCLEDSMPTLIRTKIIKEPDKIEIKKIIMCIKNRNGLSSEAVLPDGQILDGLEIIEREPKFTIE